MSILKKLKFWEPKTQETSYTDPITAAQERVSNAMDMFIKADKELTNANMELLKVIEEEQQRLAKAQETLERAEQELKTNNALKARISEFLPK